MHRVVAAGWRVLPFTADALVRPHRSPPRLVGLSFFLIARDRSCIRIHAARLRAADMFAPRSEAAEGGGMRRVVSIVLLAWMALVTTPLSRAADGDQRPA